MQLKGLGAVSRGGAYLARERASDERQRRPLERPTDPSPLPRFLPFPASDIPLRFLTHLLADLHQPLHLTGLLRGGNAHPILFQGRRTSLHALWDGVLLNRAIRELGGWTDSGDGRVERALRGRVYDPLVRFIVFEGTDLISSSSLSSSSVVPRKAG